MRLDTRRMCEAGFFVLRHAQGQFLAAQCGAKNGGIGDVFAGRSGCRHVLTWSRNKSEPEH